MPEPLETSKLRKTCDPNQFKFKTTEELQSDLHIIGQPRGTQAIEFGIHIHSPGYNIYVLGESGTGRTTAIERFIENKAANDPVPDDWVYVYNFEEPHKPICLSMPPGLGISLSQEMEKLTARLKTDLPATFEDSSFREAVLEIQQKQAGKREAQFDQIQQQAAGLDAAIINTPEGLRIVPLKGGKPISPEEFEALEGPALEAWRTVSRQLQQELNETMHRIRLLDRETQEEVQALVKRVAARVVDAALEEVRGAFESFDSILDYLQAVHADILENIHFFREDEEDPQGRRIPTDLLLRRYHVNVIIDHHLSEYAPVVAEFNPSAHRLLGRIEHESRAGGITMTDFTLLRPGALHEANGGYLVIRAKDLFGEPGAWEALKRVLIGGEIVPDDPATRSGAPIKSLNPMPIPVELKVILIGPPAVYYSLYGLDEDFKTIFKVMADFDLEMDRTFENEMEYAVFTATLCEEEGLLPFDRGAVARLVEYGSRIADSQKKLTTRFGMLADMIREANFWATKENRDVVTAADVLFGVERRIFRSDRLAAQVRENIKEGKHLIGTEGSVAGQVNGLYVSKIGEHSFGQPSRVTARTFVGKSGIVQIDREVSLTGPIHDKGVVILNGFLGAQYAEDLPLSFNAQITFEQSYSPIEGDSASSTELYALISSLAQVPVKQSIAVTGSVNQLGEVQAIGGVNQKVEGWYELCSQRGLTGEHGVLIPESNVDDLMIRAHILEQIERGMFHVWAVRNVDQGLEVLTGLPAEEIHDKARARLKKLADSGRAYD